MARVEDPAKMGWFEDSRGYVAAVELKRRYQETLKSLRRVRRSVEYLSEDIQTFREHLRDNPRLESSIEAKVQERAQLLKSISMLEHQLDELEKEAIHLE